MYAERALRAGAHGFVNKQEPKDKMIDAVRTVLSGGRYLSADILTRVMDRVIGSENQSENPLDLLTDRELEVFRMIGEGLATGVIAERLFLSPHTVETHREKIKRKLGLRTAGELHRRAVQWVLENF